MKKKLYRIIFLFFLLSVLVLTEKTLWSAKSVLALTSLPTMDDFWNGRAFFEFQNKFGGFETPGDGPYAWLGANLGTDIVVKDGAWYLFTREFVLTQDKADCIHRIVNGVVTEEIVDHPRTVVRQSVDKGKTWTDRTVIIPAGKKAIGQPTECGAVDGEAFYDVTTNTWHYLVGCLGGKTTWENGKYSSAEWGVCHYTKQGDSPLGLFDSNSSNPVFKNGALWGRICDVAGDQCFDLSHSSSAFGFENGVKHVQDEGTFEIVEKRSDGYFYITMHGFDNPHGYRGVVKTRDFVNWELVNSDAIFDKYDCQNWNVPWSTGGCIGGGAATFLKEGDYYYQLIEVPDKTLGCETNQLWIHGLVRSPDLTSTRWEKMPGSTPAILFNSEEWMKRGHTCGSIAYQRFFRDTNGEIFLLVAQLFTSPSVDEDPNTGFYLYKLKKNLPFASYKFKEGPGHEYTQSDILSNGNFEAQTFNTSWVSGSSDGSYSLDFNGTNSYVQMPDNPLFNLTNQASLKVKLKLESFDFFNQSALIAGKPGSYWLELYKEAKNLCFWICTSSCQNVCTNLTSDLNQWHMFRGVYDGNQLELFKDEISVGTNSSVTGNLNQTNETFKLGGNKTNPSDFYGSFDGQLDEVSVYDFADLPLEGDLNNDGQVSSQDIVILIRNWGSSPSNPAADLNSDGVVNGMDFEKLRKLIP